jgi:hypothetical protein
MAVEVTLDMFSGMPNPRWLLGGASEQEFRSRLQSLPAAADREAPRPPGLGYRGFILSVGPGDGGEALGRVTVYRGTVSHSGGEYEDMGRELEKWLLSTAGEALGDRLKSIMQAELARA